MICAGLALCIRNRSIRFCSTLIRPCVVFAMMAGETDMKAIRITERRPGPIHIRISGAIAMIGTVCSRMVYG